MKKVLGLDLGTTSIGWALVNEAEKEGEQSSIIRLGVRVNPLSSDELGNFEKGRSITTNADRTLKRSMRRNLQRFKLRRDQLIEILKNNDIIKNNDALCETGKASTFQTYRLRAKAATERIELEEFARVLLQINKKRGYKSNRKTDSSEEGQLVDGMDIAKVLYDEDLTPGQYVLKSAKNGIVKEPDFYRSDLEAEFDRIWDVQKNYYPELLTDELRAELQGKNRNQTWTILSTHLGVYGLNRELKRSDLKYENYQWRVKSLKEKMNLEALAVVFQEINRMISSSSGYLGAIGDRSKKLFFEHKTVGQELMTSLDRNPNCSLKNQVFYRQDYLDEFETIWEKQAHYHKELTPELKREIRDVVIFYQRRLKSQKNQISICELEGRQIRMIIDGKIKTKTIGPHVCPKSSPIFQDFKIWQRLNDVRVTNTLTREERPLEQEEKELLYKELSYKATMSANDALKLLFKNHKELELNYKELEGNRTQSDFLKLYAKIIDYSGNGEFDFSKMSSEIALSTITEIFKGLGFCTDILSFNSCLDGEAFNNQPFYKLWHLLYSYEGDNSTVGNVSLVDKLIQKWGFDKDSAKILASITFSNEYGSLSTKAIRNILPFMMAGHSYNEACTLAGYNHSARSLTKQKLAEKKYKDHLEQLPKGSLRNPVVEKIINQMVNVVNMIADTYGKPDEIRIELARELKKGAKEREETTRSINSITAEAAKIKEILIKEFGVKNPNRNAILRYRLYMELKDNGFKTPYSNTYIPREELFSKKFDIEHIIPQARLFDDSFSNKTIEARDINIEKSNMTARDFVEYKYGAEVLEEYRTRIEMLYHNKCISKAKYRKLLMTSKDIPEDFIDRDLRNSQYIARKSRELLEDMVPFVVPTTGSVTDRLREDWQLVDVMQELNQPKYRELGLTEYVEDNDGHTIERIKDWTKRNDHRHHAMDALTIAFTKRSYIQYLNNLNARVDKKNYDGTKFDLNSIEFENLSKEDRTSVVFYIENKELERDCHGKLHFRAPFPNFRAAALSQLENTLISIKAKNKVVTRNTNITIKAGGKNHQLTLTPRGQLHLETIYAGRKRYVTKYEKINAGFDETKIATVANSKTRNALLKRLSEYGGDPKKAFSGRNSLEKNPIYLDQSNTIHVPEKVKTVSFEQIYTIRKPISPDLKIEKVVDKHIRQILKDRLDKYGGDSRKAFSNIETEGNEIWLNKEKGIAIKSVTITGINNAVALRFRRDNKGKVILNKDNMPEMVDFVNTGNNHHVAIYRDAEGILQEQVVSMFEAVTRVNQGLPIIDKTYRNDDGWQFLFTMKQNEYFVFPNSETGFDPNETDLLNPDNYALISPNLFRVQKLSTKNYFFRHHLETNVQEPKELAGVTYKHLQSLAGIIGIVKVRINHIGQIVAIGEY